MFDGVPAPPGVLAVWKIGCTLLSIAARRSTAARVPKSVELSSTTTIFRLPAASHCEAPTSKMQKKKQK